MIVMIVAVVMVSDGEAFLLLPFFISVLFFLIIIVCGLELLLWL